MKKDLTKVKLPQRFDITLLLLLVVIAICSIVSIYASEPFLPAYLTVNSLIFKQTFFYCIGFIAIFSIMYVGNDNLKEFAIIGYKILLFLLIYLFIDNTLVGLLGRSSNLLPFAHSVNGATSWLNFPVIGTLQPSEFMKVVLIVICAYEIREHNEEKTDYSFSSDIELFIKILKWALAPLLLILLQPDTGIFIIIGFSLAIMLACSGIRKEWIIYTAITVGILVVLFLYLFFFQQNLFSSIFGESYRLQRIYGWLAMEDDILGSGMQLYQALLAIGSAGLMGHGLQSSVIPLTEAHTDFIFSVIGLNFGFIGCLGVILLCLALDFKILQIALRTKNQTEKIILCGFIGMLIFQQIQNIGMVIGLLPITGITLPLISYGGSSVLSYMLVFGIVMNVSSKAKKHSDYTYFN